MSEPTSSATSPSRKAKKHKKKKTKGTAAEALTDDVPAPSSAAGIGLPFLRTSISAEAGVDWGDAEMPARMQELERRHELLQWLIHIGRIDLRGIKDYHDWLCRLSNTVAFEGDAMQRRFKIASAQVAMAGKDPRRHKAQGAKLDAMMRQSQRHNREVNMCQHEVAWLKGTPAWEEAMAFLQKHWTLTPSGWISKKDVEDDASVSFDGLMSSMQSGGVGGGEGGGNDEGSENGEDEGAGGGSFESLLAAMKLEAAQGNSSSGAAAEGAADTGARAASPSAVATLSSASSVPSVSAAAGAAAGEAPGAHHELVFQVCSYCHSFESEEVAAAHGAPGAVAHRGTRAVKRHVKLAACSGCSRVAYCSKDCQRAHWKAGHSKNCFQQKAFNTAAAAAAAAAAAEVSIARK